IMIRLHLPLNIIIILFGLFVAGTMYAIMRKHKLNQAEHDNLSLIGEQKH
ncbi:MAG: lysophospholipid transporter LplT, partial [Janthinobacterium sp.]